MIMYPCVPEGSLFLYMIEKGVERFHASCTIVSENNGGAKIDALPSRYLDEYRAIISKDLSRRIKQGRESSL